MGPERIETRGYLSYGREPSCPLGAPGPQVTQASSRRSVAFYCALVVLHVLWRIETEARDRTNVIGGPAACSRALMAIDERTESDRNGRDRTRAVAPGGHQPRAAVN
jgi:hypothetical protein